MSVIISRIPAHVPCELGIYFWNFTNIISSMFFFLSSLLFSSHPLKPKTCMRHFIFSSAFSLFHLSSSSSLSQTKRCGPRSSDAPKVRVSFWRRPPPRVALDAPLHSPRRSVRCTLWLANPVVGSQEHEPSLAPSSVAVLELFSFFAPFLFNCCWDAKRMYSWAKMSWGKENETRGREAKREEHELMLRNQLEI